MSKILTIAQREYRAIVGTKAFLIALIILPLLMFGGIAVQKTVEGRVGPERKRIVVLDRTGVLLAKLSEAAQARNQHEIFDLQTGKQIKPRYEIEAGPPGDVSDQTRLELSERVRRGEIDSFVEIPAEALQVVLQGEPPKAFFHAENAPLADEKNWLQYVIGEAVRTRRLQEAGLDPRVVQRASAPVMVEPASLVERTEGGDIMQPQQASMQQMVFVPFGIMMLMWMVIFLASQPLLESTLEEKTQRIAEVLLGSAHPFQLMLGKLLGGVGGSLTIVAVYGVGAYALAYSQGMADVVPLRVLPWFVVYQVLAVLLFGSIFMAVGAAVNQFKEAQGMLLPVWLIVMYPLFIWLQVVREPTSSFATWLSLVPPGSPLLMVLRIGASGAVPIWQPLLGIVLMVAFTLLIVAAAARVFRIAILAQGKTPSLAELLRWAARG